MSEASQPESRSLLRNPWAWGIAIGLVLPLLIRPFTRHIPEPPPVVRELQALTINPPDGVPFVLGSAVQVVAVFGMDCDCGDALVELQRLAQGFAHWELPVDVVVLASAPDAALGETWQSTVDSHLQRFRVVVADSSSQEWIFRDLFDEVDQTRFETGGVVPRVALVDPQRRLRGRYPLDRAGLQEAFARAQRIAYEEAASESR